MTNTVIQAFDEFLKNFINLLPETTDTARHSRDWLISQINNSESKEELFPELYSDINISFGSFARKTKIRELDDIDLMLGLKAEGSKYIDRLNAIEIDVPNEAVNLRRLCFENSSKLNSRKVINKFVSMLSLVPQYSKAAIKRNQEAATLKLNTYSWNFDIVPCFMTNEDIHGQSYYLIPDGEGNWKKTDPRKDRKRVTNINQQHSGNILSVIRVMKYWNENAQMPNIPSYVLETIILDYYEAQLSKASSYVDVEIPNILYHISTAVINSVSDPKNIQGDINSLTYLERLKILEVSKRDYQKSLEARQLENDNNMQGSINKWKEVFGNDFPEFS